MREFVHDKTDTISSGRQALVRAGAYSHLYLRSVLVQQQVYQCYIWSE